MKLLLIISALLAIAYSAPFAADDESPQPIIAVDVPGYVSDPQTISAVGVPGYISAPKPHIEINISINGVATPYSEQNLVYVEVRNPALPPQIAVPGYDYIPDPDGEFEPINGPGNAIYNDPGLIIPL